MIFVYGSYTHDDNECWFSLDKQVVRGKTGTRTSIRERWTITGVKKAASETLLTAALLDLERAYGRDYQNLLLYGTGNVPTRHGLINAETLTGVTVKSFRYLPGNPQVWGSGTEYVLRRTFQVVLEADRLDVEQNVISYHETVQQIGNGGEKFKMVGSLTGPVQKQIVQKHTPFIAIQSGSAVGLLSYPSPPAGMFRSSLHNELETGSVDSPLKFSPVVNSQYRVSWKYVSESATSLIGGPTQSF